MCYGCYQEYGSPSIITDKTKEAAALIDRVYEFSDDQISELRLKLYGLTITGSCMPGPRANQIFFTPMESIGKDELYCEFFRCPNCNQTGIAKGYSFCPDCGSALRW